MTPINNGKIYESPDKGETVYVRMSGTLERTKVSESLKARLVSRWYEWRDILQASQDNVTLADLIKRVEEVYALTKENP